MTIANLYKTHVLGLRPTSDSIKSNELDPFTNQNIFRYQENRKNSILTPLSSSFGQINDELTNTLFKNTRKIPKIPFKVLDAPALQDDFYLNLIDWSH